MLAKPHKRQVCLCLRQEYGVLAETELVVLDVLGHQGSDGLEREVAHDCSITMAPALR